MATHLQIIQDKEAELQAQFTQKQSELTTAISNRDMVTVRLLEADLQSITGQLATLTEVKTGQANIPTFADALSTKAQEVETQLAMEWSALATANQLQDAAASSEAISQIQALSAKLQTLQEMQAEEL